MRGEERESSLIDWLFCPGLESGGCAGGERESADTGFCIRGQAQVPLVCPRKVNNKWPIYGYVYPISRTQQAPSPC